MPTNPLDPLHVPADLAVRWVTYAAEAEESYLALLSVEEHDRLRGFTHPKRRRDFTLGRTAARLLLADRLGVDPREVPLHVAEDGAVDVAGQDVRVSIAHSGGHAVAAVARRAVGVDLEVIAPRHPRLRRFLLHPDEVQDLETLPLDPNRATLLYWTVKEATLKALRTGFRLSPKNLHVSLDYPSGAATIRVEGGQVFTGGVREQEGCFLALVYDP